MLLPRAFLELIPGMATDKCIKGQLSGKLSLFFKFSMVSLWHVISLFGEISDISSKLIFL